MARLSDGGMTRTFEQNRNARLVPSANESRSEKSTRGERRSNGRASHKEQRGQNATGVNLRFDMSTAQSRQSPAYRAMRYLHSLIPPRRRAASQSLFPYVYFVLDLSKGPQGIMRRYSSCIITLLPSSIFKA